MSKRNCILPDCLVSKCQNQRFLQGFFHNPGPLPLRSPAPLEKMSKYVDFTQIALFSNFKHCVSFFSDLSYRPSSHQAMG